MGISCNSPCQDIDNIILLVLSSPPLATFYSFLTEIDQQQKVLSQTATPHLFGMQQLFPLSYNLRTQLQICPRNGGLCQTATPIRQELYPNVSNRFCNRLKSKSQMCKPNTNKSKNSRLEKGDFRNVSMLRVTFVEEISGKPLTLKARRAA